MGRTYAVNTLISEYQRARTCNVLLELATDYDDDHVKEQSDICNIRESGVWYRTGNHHNFV
jgi:hypothetical protein